MTIRAIARVGWIGVLALGGVAAGGQQGGVKPAGTVTVQVLAINDLHGNLEAPAGRDGMVGKVPAGGVEYLATHLKMEEAREPSILVGAGDLMGASRLLSALFQDAPTIESLNAMGMAVTSIGNHEMDHGTAELKRRLKAARYEYLAANVLQDGRPIFAATSVRVVGGVKIGFIGETLEGSPRVIAAGAIQGDRFLEESAVANAAAARLEKAGVHAIVLLIHQGGAQHDELEGRDVNGCASFSGEIQGIAEKLSPAIQVVISGHTHQYYNCKIAGHVVTSAGAYGRMFTSIQMTVERRTDRVVGVTAVNEIVTQDVAKDAAQTAILDRYRSREEAVAKRVEGSAVGPISRKANAAGESALGDVIADAQLASVAAKAKGGPVLALMNSGGIRADVAAGPVSFGDLYSVQPFGNQVTVVTLTGEQLRRALEEQFHGEALGPMLQVSDGFTYQYRLHAAAGEHVVAGSMKLHGRVIAPEERLRVEANNFLVAGAEGLTALREGTDAVAGPADVDALVEYFQGHSPVKAGGQDRIVRLD